MGGNRSDRKLTWAQRDEVYRSRQGGPDPYIRGDIMAARLGVSTTVISHIRTGKAYKGRPGEPIEYDDSRTRHEDYLSWQTRVKELKKATEGK